MANKHNGEVSVTIDGEKMVLRYTLADLVNIEDDLGVALSSVLLNLENMHMKTVLTMLYHGLNSRDVDISEEAIAESDIDLVSAIEAVSAALALSLGAGEDEKKSKASKAKKKKK
jgi:hypothetical protein